MNKPQCGQVLKVLGILLLLTALLQASSAFAAGKKACSAIFDETPPQQELVERIIHDLANMRLSLDIAKAQGLNSIAMTGIASEYNAKEQAIIHDFEIRGIMTREELLQKMNLQIAQLQNFQIKDQAQIEEAKKEEARSRKIHEKRMKTYVIDGQNAVFSPVAAGNFKGGYGKYANPITLTRDFEIMATPVTQIIWRKVAQLANKKLRGKNKIRENPSETEGDTLPVTNISTIEAKAWIKAFNELSSKGEPALEDFVAGHVQGDVYALPTEAQWEFVVRGRGKLNGEYHFGNDKNQLGDYGWSYENSQNQVHPVAQKKPLKFENVEVYDMHGNVWELTRDEWADTRPSGTDPERPASGKYYDVTIRGGSARDMNVVSSSDARAYTSADSDNGFIGFRLIREVQNQDGK